MIEIRWHGRGGQGAVTSVEMLALAAIEEGKFGQGFPSFGPERRGAPVIAFNRINDVRIKIKSGVYTPDMVIVLDDTLIGLVNVIEGLKPEGKLVINTSKSQEKIREQLGFKGTLGTVDAMRIAREELGVPITNTTMLGAAIKALGIVDIKSAKNPIEGRFGRLAARNLKAMSRAYDEVKIN